MVDWFTGSRVGLSTGFSAKPLIQMEKDTSPKKKEKTSES